MLLMRLLALQIVVEATIIAAFGDEQDQVELGPNSCSLADFYKRGFQIRQSRKPIGDAERVKEGQEFSVECSANYIDNMFDKKATRARCECEQGQFNETVCAINPQQEGYRCISMDICPLPIWQGARTHTVKAVDDDWALLSFKLRKDKALSKHHENFSWSEYIPKDQNWTIVLACPFNVLGVEYDNDPDKDELQEMIDEGVSMMKDCRGDDMQRASMMRNTHRRQRKEKKMARLARKAAREGRHARRNGDFTDKLCQMVKDDDKQKYDENSAELDESFEDKCPCDRKTWRGRKYIGRVSSIDGRVTSSSGDGRMWTIVSKGEGGVGNNGSREFKIAIDMLNGVNPLKWKTTKEMKQNKSGSANQYTCELGIVVGHYPHLAPCLDKFHKLDIYKHHKDYNYMKKNNLLPTEPAHTKPEPEHTKPEKTKPDYTEPEQTKPEKTKPDHTEHDHSEHDHTKPKPTGPKPTGEPKPTVPEFGQRRDPFGKGMANNGLFSNDLEE